MCSVVVVVKDVRVQQPLQLSFIQDDHMVKQIPAAVAHPTLGNPVLPLASETGLLWLNAKAPHCVDDFLIEARAAIKDQVAGHRVVGECLAQLLNKPGTAWIPGHVAMKDMPSIMGDNEEAVKHAEVSVGTVKKSIAAMASLRLLRKAAHRFAGSEFRGAFRIQRKTVRSDMS